MPADADALAFQSFAYGAPHAPPAATAAYAYAPAHPALPPPGSWAAIRAAFSTGGFPDEPPLLDELGINFAHIRRKALAVLNPLGSIDRDIMDDADLAGPVIFCFLFGGFLLLSSKVYFGYIYGVATLGWLSMYAILNLMSETGIDGSRTASVLGYSLLPMVIASSLSMVFSSTGWIGMSLTALSVLWATSSSSAIFVSVLSLTDQRLLVAYPIALLYGTFALLATF